MEVKTRYMGIMILVILIFIGIGMITIRKTTQTTQTVQKEGFQSGYQANTPNVQFCPPWAPEVQTAKGFTDCCQGDFLDGKCQGTTWCTQSPSREGIESCLSRWKKYYAEKSRTECPRSMPHYYGNPRNSGEVAGCSAAPVRNDGLLPQNVNERKCRIYPDAWSNMTRADSCFIEKGRLNVKCPRMVGVSSAPRVQADKSGTFQYFDCSLNDPARLWLPSACLDDGSASAFYDRTKPNWRQGQAGEDTLDSFCSRAATIRLRLIARRLAEEAERKRRQLLEKAMGAARKAKEAAERKAREAADTLRKQREEAQRRQRDLERQLAEMRNRCKR